MFFSPEAFSSVVCPRFIAMRLQTGIQEQQTRLGRFHPRIAFVHTNLQCFIMCFLRERSTSKLFKSLACHCVREKTYKQATVNKF